MLEQAAEHAPVEGDAEFLLALGEEAARSGGAMGFDRFMELALYDPRFGYYIQEQQRVGREGDFVTSVSVGRCFGMLLARHLAPVLEGLAKAGEGELCVVEPGAEGGELAGDLMASLAELLDAGLFQRIRYVAVEPFAEKRADLAQRLAAQGVGDARVISDWAELGGDSECGARGVLIGNEVLDAMPVRRLRLVQGQWMELCVEVAEAGCREVTRPIADEIAAGLPTDLGEGFTVERNAGLRPWFGQVAGAFQSLYGLFIDYGLERSEMFYDAGRSAGTLRGYVGHRLVEDPLEAPGAVDLTAHVDFECAAHAATLAGLKARPVEDQGRFLVAAARPWLLEIEARGGAPNASTAKLLRQFQTLTHPGAMGMSFKVMAVEKGLPG